MSTDDTTHETPKPGDGGTRPPVNILAPQVSQPRRIARTALWILALSFVMGLIALLGAIYLDKSFERKIDRLQRTTDEIRREIQDGLRPSLRSLTERQDGLNIGNTQLTDRVSKMSEQLAESTAAQGQLSSMVQGGRRAWILYEVEYLLLNANDRLQLEGDVVGAIRALEAASQRLGVAADPQLLSVRSRVIQELVALRAVPQPDVQSIALTLSTLGQSVPELPLRSRVPENFSGSKEAVATTESKTRWERFLKMVSRALGGLATIRVENRLLEPLLPPDQAFFLQQNLQLKLENARLAVLHRDTQGFRSSVTSARSWLQEYYDTDHARVKSTMDELAGFERLDLSIALPDVTGSLNLLRNEMEARGVKPTQAAPVPPPAKASASEPADNSTP